MYSICLTNAVRGTALMLGLASSLSRSYTVTGGGWGDGRWDDRHRIWVWRAGAATGKMRICGHADLRIEQRVKCGSECGRKSANYPPARVAYWPLTTGKMRIWMRTLRSWNNVICFNLPAVCIYYFLYHLMANKDCVVDLFTSETATANVGNANKWAMIRTLHR